MIKVNACLNNRIYCRIYVHGLGESHIVRIFFELIKQLVLTLAKRRSTKLPQTDLPVAISRYGPFKPCSHGRQFTILADRAQVIQKMVMVIIWRSFSMSKQCTLSLSQHGQHRLPTLRYAQLTVFLLPDGIFGRHKVPILVRPVHAHNRPQS